MIKDLPYFYSEVIPGSGEMVSLPEESARHIAQVLRMKEGDLLHLTDGKGARAVAEIRSASKRNVTLVIKTKEIYNKPAPSITIAVSPLKNSARFEWFIEKATELGISSIIPIICTRTERQHFRMPRMMGILQSAMLQSKQVWMPQLGEPVLFQALVNSIDAKEKLIAWCGEGEKKNLAAGADSDTVVLIGPEGDFTEEEIHAALKAGFKSVTLGNTRLRTETAAITAAVMLTR